VKAFDFIYSIVRFVSDLLELSEQFSLKHIATLIVLLQQGYQ